MLDTEVLIQLTCAQPEERRKALFSLEGFKPSSLEEAQAIVNMLVPFFKSDEPDQKNMAQGIFQGFKKIFPKVEYPKELMDSLAQLRRVKKDLMGERSEQPPPPLDKKIEGPVFPVARKSGYFSTHLKVLSTYALIATFAIMGSCFFIYSIWSRVIEPILDGHPIPSLSSLGFAKNSPTSQKPNVKANYQRSEIDKQIVGALGRNIGLTKDLLAYWPTSKNVQEFQDFISKNLELRKEILYGLNSKMNTSRNSDLEKVATFLRLQNDHAKTILSTFIAQISPANRYYSDARRYLANQRNLQESLYKQLVSAEKDLEQWDWPMLYAWSARSLADGKAAFKTQLFEIAFEIFQWHANEGDLGAQVQLANMYYKGEGIGKDFKKAYAWFQKAASQGESKAQVILSKMLIEGQGVGKNYSEAYKWALKAGEKGEVGAQNNLGLLCFLGVGSKPR